MEISIKIKKVSRSAFWKLVWAGLQIEPFFIKEKEIKVSFFVATWSCIYNTYFLQHNYSSHDCSGLCLNLNQCLSSSRRNDLLVAEVNMFLFLLFVLILQMFSISFLMVLWSQYRFFFCVLFWGYILFQINGNLYKKLMSIIIIYIFIYNMKNNLHVA